MRFDEAKVGVRVVTLNFDDPRNCGYIAARFCGRRCVITEAAAGPNTKHGSINATVRFLDDNVHTQLPAWALAHDKSAAAGGKRP